MPVFGISVLPGVADSAGTDQQDSRHDEEIPETPAKRFLLVLLRRHGGFLSSDHRSIPFYGQEGEKLDEFIQRHVK